MCLIVISPFTSHQSLGESRDWLIFLFVDTILTAARKETFPSFARFYTASAKDQFQKFAIYTEEDDISNESYVDTNIYRIALLRCRFSGNSSRKSDGKDAHRVRRMAFDSYGEFHPSLAPSPCVPSKQCNTI